LLRSISHVRWTAREFSQKKETNYSSKNYRILV
jgi:hypothetical protein